MSLGSLPKRCDEEARAGFVLLLLLLKLSSENSTQKYENNYNMISIPRRLHRFMLVYILFLFSYFHIFLLILKILFFIRVGKRGSRYLTVI